MLAGTGIELLSLLDYPSIPEIEEDGSTFLENALKKAKTVADSTGEAALADDSGIEIDFLGGRPGIYSARYSGPGATDEKNNRKVLSELKGVPLEKRTAAFRCVLVLYRPDGKYKVFEGSWKGLIGFEPRGTLGFGYDPIFIDPAAAEDRCGARPGNKKPGEPQGPGIQEIERRTFRSGASIYGVDRIGPRLKNACKVLPAWKKDTSFSGHSAAW